MDLPKLSPTMTSHTRRVTFETTVHADGRVEETKTVSGKAEFSSRLWDADEATRKAAVDATSVRGDEDGFLRLHSTWSDTNGVTVEYERTGVVVPPGFTLPRDRGTPENPTLLKRLPATPGVKSHYRVTSPVRPTPSGRRCKTVTGRVDLECPWGELAADDKRAAEESIVVRQEDGYKAVRTRHLFEGKLGTYEVELCDFGVPAQGAKGWTPFGKVTFESQASQAAGGGTPSGVRIDYGTDPGISYDESGLAWWTRPATPMSRREGPLALHEQTLREAQAEGWLLVGEELKADRRFVMHFVRARA